MVVVVCDNQLGFVNLDLQERLAAMLNQMAGTFNLGGLFSFNSQNPMN